MERIEISNSINFDHYVCTSNIRVKLQNQNGLSCTTHYQEFKSGTCRGVSWTNWTEIILDNCNGFLINPETKVLLQTHKLENFPDERFCPNTIRIFWNGSHAHDSYLISYMDPWYGTPTTNPTVIGCADHKSKGVQGCSDWPNLYSSFTNNVPHSLHLASKGII